MSSIVPLGSRQYQTQNQTQTPSLQNSGLQSSANRSGSTLAADARSALDYVSLSKSGIALSAQGLADRADAMGSATVDVAQNFISSFAQSLLGDSAKGATLSFDSASLETHSAYAALAQHTSGASGTTDAAAFRLDESSHFIGKGTITTADGQTLSFEIEVEYTSSTAAAVSQSSDGTDATGATTDGTDSTTAPTSTSGKDGTSGSSGSSGSSGTSGTAGSDADSDLSSKDLGNISFPGSLNDLFQLLGKQLQATLANASDSNSNSNSNDSNSTSASSATNSAGLGSGTLRLRLLNLLNTTSLVSATTPATASTATSATDGTTTPATGTTTASGATTTPAIGTTASDTNPNNLTDAQLAAKALSDAYGTAQPVPLAPDSTSAGSIKDKA